MSQEVTHVAGGAGEGARGRVLVTGASGFVGRALVAELRRQGRDVSALVRRREQALELGVHPLVGDVTDAGSLDGIDGFAEVYHLAGVLAARRADTFQRVNVDGCRNLYDALRRAPRPPRRIVHVSSIAAGGPALDATPRREAQPDAPVSLYGRTKLGGESVAKSFMSDLPIVILRPAVVYGPQDRNLLPIFLMARRGLVLRPPEQPKLFSLVHVGDLARILIRCASGDALVGGRFNVATGPPASWDDLVAGIGAGVGRRPRQIGLGRWPYVALAYAHAAGSLLGHGARVDLLIPQKLPELFAKYWHVDTRSLWSALGEFETTPLAAGLAQTADWYRREGWVR